MLVQNDISALERPVAIENIKAVAEAGADFLSQIREAMLAPFPRKLAPSFNSVRLLQLCGIEKRRLQYLIEKGDAPSGRLRGNGKARLFSLEETIQTVILTDPKNRRPETARGRVITVANYKGGVAKTSTAVTLAQGLTLLGRKVLLVDLDPQGTATQLCGWAPDAEIQEPHTLLPLLYGSEKSPEYAIRQTYWHNLDAIPAAACLNEAEFDLPGRLLSDRTFRFWSVLADGLAHVWDRYDAIVVDTPPSLGMLTINALVATDGLIIPCPPRALDFASTVQFWNNFSDYLERFPGVKDKQFDFVKVLPTLSNQSDISQVVMTWLQKAYGNHLYPFTIPVSKVAEGTTTTLSTVYDLSDEDENFSKEAIQRLRDPYDKFSRAVNDSLAYAWGRATGAIAPAAPITEAQPS
jgi:chromosome partitioning protein